MERLTAWADHCGECGGGEALRLAAWAPSVGYCADSSGSPRHSRQLGASGVIDEPRPPTTADLCRTDSRLLGSQEGFPGAP